MGAKDALTPGGLGLKTEIVVTGPDDAEWRYPLPVDQGGNLHYLFNEKTTATGTYQARIEVNGALCAIDISVTIARLLLFTNT